MWQTNSLIGDYIVVQTTPVINTNPVQRAKTTPQCVIFIMDPDKTEKPSDDGSTETKEDDKDKEPGVEIRQGPSFTPRLSFPYSPHLPSLHSAFQATSPIIKSYKSILQGWKNSVPRLYKYPSSDIEIVVYRKNGQVDKLKQSDATVSNFMKSTNPSNTYMYIKDVDTSTSPPTYIHGIGTVSPPEPEQISMRKNPVTLDEDGSMTVTVPFGPEAVKKLYPEEDDMDSGEDKSPSPASLPTGSAPDSVVTEKDDAHSITANGSAADADSSPDLSLLKQELAFLSSFSCEKGACGPDSPGTHSPSNVTPLQTNPGSEDAQRPMQPRCCYIRIGKVERSPRSVANASVSRAFLDVSTQATEEFVKTLSTSIQHVPETVDSCTQSQDDVLACTSNQREMEYAEVSTQMEELIVDDFACQVQPTTEPFACQVESERKALVTSSSQTFCAMISEGTQTNRDSMCVGSKATQTFIPRGSTMSQTDPDMMRAMGRINSIASQTLDVEREHQICQTDTETQDFQCQVDVASEPVDDKPQLVDKSVMAKGYCMKTAQRVKQVYEKRLALILKTINLKLAASARAMEPQPGPSSPGDGEGQGASGLGDSPQARIQALISRYRQQQQESDEIYEELRGLLEQLTDQVSIENSLNSTGYIEDDWLDDHDHSPSA